MSACPLCNSDHDEVLSLLADEPIDQLRRIPSDDLRVEEEYIRRELVAADVDGDYAGGVRILYRHRLQVIEGEIARRVRLESYGAPHVPGRSRIPPEVIRDIKEAVDLERLVGEDLELGRVKPDKSWFHCKLHGADSDPSFMVEGTRWRCWGCRDSGDAFDYLIKVRGMAWIEALRYLSNRTPIELPQPGREKAVFHVG